MPTEAVRSSGNVHAPAATACGLWELSSAVACDGDKEIAIMLFDECALMPSFGYVFDREWLDPLESIMSILRQMAKMN